MSTVELVLLTLLIIDSFALTALVLIQQGKGADVGAAFGSGSANTVFGSSGGGGFLTRLTTWLAIAFFAIALGLAYTAKERAASGDRAGIPTAPEIPAVMADDAMEADMSQPLGEANDAPVGDIPEM